MKRFDLGRVVVLSSPESIRQLDTDVARLLPERDITFEPAFFLASMSSEWRPRVVVVRGDDGIAGVVYAKERQVARLPTGLLCLDARLGNMVIARPGDTDFVIQAAIRKLLRLPHVRGLRLLIPPNGIEAQSVDNARRALGLDLNFSSPDLHARLPLPQDYERFVGSLGRATRHNFRHYRRKSEAAGNVYVEHLSAADLERAMRSLRSKSWIRTNASDVARALNVIAVTDSRWAVGLKDPRGEWLSVAAGWSTASEAIMFLQMNNDREHEKASLSVVLRGYLIEHLIRRGTQALLFWAGTAPPLRRYAEQIPAITVHLDAPTAAWRLIRQIGRFVEPLFSGDIARELQELTGRPRPAPAVRNGGT